VNILRMSKKFEREDKELVADRNKTQVRER